jgi:hypothetical protein
MPSTEAQKRASRTYTKNHPEIVKMNRERWLENEDNYQKHLGYVKKHMKKRYEWKKVSMELLKCLL